MVQPAIDVTPNASPTTHIAITQRADVTFLFPKFMFEVYGEMPADGCSRRNSARGRDPALNHLLSRVNTPVPPNRALARGIGTQAVLTSMTRYYACGRCACRRQVSRLEENDLTPTAR
jgi:hypothetical protein